MSLLVCPECGRNVSEYSEKCPECGCPISVIKSIIKKRNRPPIPEGFCNINGVLCNKEELREMYENNTIWNYLIERCQLPGSEILTFYDIYKMNNGEFPDDYSEAVEQLIERNLAEREANVVKCPYCRSTNVEKRSRSINPLVPRVWYKYCKNCGREF